ncbi:MAG: dihydropteroate synthase [Bacteroidales bacterium]|nr:dihydropteroate synthase [Bacteroidales bacterium]
MNKSTFFSPFSLNCRKNIISYDRPSVMGILNVTPDSFFDGGTHTTPEAYLSHARHLLDEGADILDVGVVSSRPGAHLLEPDVEAQRLSAVMRLLRSELPDDTILSVDTCYSRPAAAAVEAGADIINDISGGQFDPQMFATVASLRVPYVLSHTRGLPSQMQQLAHYDDLLRDLQHYFSEKLDTLYRLGVADVILDPGFGFAKTQQHNYLLLRHLDQLCTTFTEPVLVGISRKRMIYNALDTTPQQALNGTTVLNTAALMQGARMLRVHDPRQAREAITLCSHILAADDV